MWQYTSDVYKRFWETALISLDSNVLLHLYWLNREQLAQVNDVFEQLRDRLIITDKAAYEYFIYQSNKIRKPKLWLEYVYALLTNTWASFEKELQTHYSALPEHSPERVIQMLESTKNKSLEIIRKKKEEIAGDSKLGVADTVLEVVLKTLSGCLATELTPEKQQAIRAEADSRFAKNDGPGSADRKEKDGENLYGDMMIWSHLKLIAKERNQWIIFVTDDTKDDWWWKPNGDRRGITPSLAKEFYEETEQEVMLQTLEDFIRHISGYYPDLKVNLLSTLKPQSLMSKAEPKPSLDELLKVLEDTLLPTGIPKESRRRSLSPMKQVLTRQLDADGRNILHVDYPSGVYPSFRIYEWDSENVSNHVDVIRALKNNRLLLGAKDIYFYKYETLFLDMEYLTDREMRILSSIVAEFDLKLALDSLPF